MMMEMFLDEQKAKENNIHTCLDTSGFVDILVKRVILMPLWKHSGIYQKHHGF